MRSFKRLAVLVSFEEHTHCRWRELQLLLQNHIMGQHCGACDVYCSRCKQVMVDLPSMAADGAEIREYYCREERIRWGTLQRGSKSGIGMLDGEIVKVADLERGRRGSAKCCSLLVGWSGKRGWLWSTNRKARRWICRRGFHSASIPEIQDHSMSIWIMPDSCCLQSMFRSLRVELWRNTGQAPVF